MGGGNGFPLGFMKRSDSMHQRNTRNRKVRFGRHGDFGCGARRVGGGPRPVGSRPPVGLREDLDGVHDPDAQPPPPEAHLDLKRAARVADGQHGCPGGFNGIDLLLEQPVGRFRLCEVVNPGAAAAPVRPGEIGPLHSGDETEKVAGGADAPSDREPGGRRPGK